MFGQWRAFIDESDAEPTKARLGTYVLAAALVNTDEQQLCDDYLRCLLRPEDVDPKGHARLHLSRIRDKVRKKEVVASLACFRDSKFVVAWMGGYTNPTERVRVRGLLLWELLPHLVSKEAVKEIVFEQGEMHSLRAADARVVGKLRDQGLLPGDVVTAQHHASSQPALWLADFAAGAWRRHFVDIKDNWSRWYAPHTNLIEVPYRKRQRRATK